MLSRRSRHGSLFAVAALTTLGVAAPAGAAPTGATTIDLKGASAKALSGQKVRIAAQKPARASAKRIVLAVSGGTVAGGATLKHKGSVTFSVRAGGRTRSAKLTGWETKVGTTRSTVTAKLGAKRVTLFTIAAPKARVTLDRAAGTAKLTRGTVRLTPAGAKALRAKLALRRLPAGQLGVAKVSARVGATTTPGTGTPTPTPGTPGVPGPVSPTDPGAPRVGPIQVEPPMLPRPASATDVTGARLTWWARDSFVAYIAGGSTPPATGATASNGAVAQAPIDARDHLCKDDPKLGIPPLSYAFDFPFSSGWYDAGSGHAGLYFTGKVRFAYASHGIDLSAADPEIELTGASTSRTIFRFDGGSNTRLGNRRDILTRLDVARAARTVDPVTRTVTYGPILGTLADGSSNSFAGFYFPGDGYGCVQVSFTY